MGKNIILFVDDEENILHAIRRAVISEDFTALFANSGAEALELMGKNEISVLVTDMMMPQMNGLSLLKEVKRLYPMTMRVILSGHTQMSEMIAAINEGDIFRFIPKPWNLEIDLLPVIRQAIEYYNLRRDKEILEKSLHQKNLVYKNMLRTLEEKFYKKQWNFNYLQNVMLLMISDLEKELMDKDITSKVKSILKLELLKKITTDYFQTIPVTLEEFTLQDIEKSLNNCLTKENFHKQYKIKNDNAVIKGVGNFKLFLMILLQMIKILCRLGEYKTFKHVITSQIYQEKEIVRINNVIEFGYVDISKVAIDSEELLSHSNLEFYTRLLTQLGQPHGFDATYTYVNQNISLITISGEFTIV